MPPIPRRCAERGTGLSVRLEIRGCSVVDALDERPRSDWAVQIQDDRIAWAGPAAEAPSWSDARVIDLEGGYLLPGLVDVHVHLFYLQALVPRAENVAAHTMYCAGAAIDALHGGFTGLRSAGDGWGVDIALRNAFKAGPILGPRLWVAGFALTPSGGHTADREEFWGRRICDGVEGWRKAARDQLQADADHLKAIVTGGAMGHEQDVTGATTIVEEELEAAAQVFHSRGRPVMVHATSSEGVRMAVRAGARTVEHGYELDDEAIELLVRSGTYLTPTLSITHQIPSEHADEYERAAFRANGRPPWRVKRAEERIEGHKASFRKALAAGVQMLVGSDFSPLPVAGHCELAFMVLGGMTPWQAIVAATRNAADAVGQLDHLGTVERGKLADLIAVGENPLDDVRHLRRPLLVLRGGRVAVDGLAAD